MSNRLHLVYTMFFSVKMASGVKRNSALYFCDGAQLAQTFCMHVFAEDYAYVSYDMKLSNFFHAL